MKFIKSMLIKIIEFYQKNISFLLKSRCRFYPTCSQYSKKAIKKHGSGKGLLLSIKRVLKCNPFFKGGIDLP